jgi:hypothetical protein
MNNTTKTVMVNDTTPQFVTWFEGMIKLSNDNYDKNLPHSKRETFTSQVGGRYVKIVRHQAEMGHGRSVHAFIDRTNGDVLKPASWAAPAKTARGNIFDESNGLARMTAYGPEYLRC